MKTILALILFFAVGCEEVYLRNPFSTKPPIVVHVMTPSDYFVVPPGARIEWEDMTIQDPEGKMIELPGDLIFVEKWGSFYSNEAQEQIMEAKVDN